jgi:DNA repair protein RadA/Sms
MAKSRVQFICQNCGTVHTRWAGKCDACGEWNTLIEEGTSGGIGAGPASTRSARKGRAVVLTSLSGDIEDAPRIASGIGRARPGDGRRLRARLGAAGRRRPGHRQVDAAAPIGGGRPGATGQAHRLRVGRGGRGADPAARAAAGAAATRRCARRPRRMSRIILATLAEGRRPDLVIIDSIQTLWTDRPIRKRAGHGDAGAHLGAGADTALRRGVGAAVVLVGHVTKDGQIAGTARGRAHGRRRALFRGGWRATRSASCAG